MRTLRELLDEQYIQRSWGSLDVVIGDIVTDSRKVKPGDLFVALVGEHVDGHHYMDEALRLGAVALIGSRFPVHPNLSVPCVEWSQAPLAFASLAERYYGIPARSLKIYGVTGTDGKSSTSFFLYQILRHIGRKTALISTIGHDWGSGFEKNFDRYTTPDPLSLQKALRLSVDAGCTDLVLEVSSHALSPRTARVSTLFFDVGILTHVSSEHLDFHGTQQNYLDDKARLFKSSQRSILNSDDEHYEFFKESAFARVFSYGYHDGLDLRLAKTTEHSHGFMLQFLYRGQSFQVFVPLVGDFNQENVMAALLAALVMYPQQKKELFEAPSFLNPPQGRMQLIPTASWGRRLIIDYAHTAHSFSKIMPLLKKTTKGRLLALFGSAGERDREKRPQQGLVASQWCEILVLCDEDPREEDPLKILEEIAQGCQGKKQGEDLFLIPSRREAIRKLLELSQEGDTLLFLGKGHESSMIYPQAEIPWDEEAILHQILEDFIPEKVKETLR